MKKWIALWLEGKKLGNLEEVLALSAVGGINDTGPCNQCEPEPWVKANGKGLSVAPDNPRNLILHRRPPALGGTGKDPVWSIETGIGLGIHAVQYVGYVEDKPGQHGVLAPRIDMPLRIYQDALHSTQNQWEFVVGPSPREPIAESEIEKQPDKKDTNSNQQLTASLSFEKSTDKTKVSKQFVTNNQNLEAKEIL